MRYGRSTVNIEVGNHCGAQYRTDTGNGLKPSSYFGGQGIYTQAFLDLIFDTQQVIIQPGDDLHARRDVPLSDILFGYSIICGQGSLLITQCHSVSLDGIVGVDQDGRLFLGEFLNGVNLAFCKLLDGMHCQSCIVIHDEGC